ncbi:MAG: ABC transporter ATP-binding protein [Chloroflexota bacterium]
MNDVVISVEGLGKRYQIGHQRDPYGRLTESLWDALLKPLELVRGRRGGETSEWIWALRDVSFEVREGDVVGVIGRNGSGKTTLLKVLSRITEPTVGSAVLRGRVGSLLEVGTGFHQELTGRENVFMSGAVLGMRRAEIIRKFDEIVEFAGVEQFLDTPVKRYSSGMQVRLGFAVAAHLEPEILFIDEVLAVGDAEFQKKCLGKMSELGQGGRTILFVSHSMPAMLRLCERAILLDHGQVVTSGPSHAVVRAYLESDLGTTSERRWDDPSTAPGDEVARLRSVRVTSARGGRADEVDIREAIDIEVEYWSAGLDNLRPTVNLAAYNDEDTCIFTVIDQANENFKNIPRRPCMIRSTARIPGQFLAEGRVTVNVAVVTYNPFIGHAVELDAVAFHVVDRTEGDGVRGEYAGPWPGVVRPMLEWNIEWAPDA